MSSDLRSETEPRELIIVCCHAIYLPNYPLARPEEVKNEENWLLADFQRSRPGKEGEHLTFCKHIERACELSPGKTDIVFSGGATKARVRKTEAQGYADALDMLSKLRQLHPHGSMVGTERRATDSFQNILFTLIHQYESKGVWPSFVTVVTHKFKEARIRHHMRALKWPEDRFRVEGIDPPFGEQERADVERFEARCLEEWKADLYGVKPPLSTKRAKRLWDPSEIDFSEMTRNSTLRQLLEWDGGDDPSAVFPRTLPWEACKSEV